MKSIEWSFKPILSLFFLFCAVFIHTIFKMEVRRNSYSVYKLSKNYQSLEDHHRMMASRLEVKTGNSSVAWMAQHRLSLNEPELGQVIKIQKTEITAQK